MMKPDIERNLGPQPLADIMAQHGLAAHDLVAASTEQITHKMVARAVKGRRLTLKHPAENPKGPPTPPAVSGTL